METTIKKRQDTEVLASDILVAILVNLKRFSNKQQLFLKVSYSTFQEIFKVLCLVSDSEFIKKYFVFGMVGSFIYSPLLQEAIEIMQLAGMVCWPDIQEPDLMRLNPSAEDRYEKVLTGDDERKLHLQDIIRIQTIVRKINEIWPHIIVDRSYLTNY